MPRYRVVDADALDSWIKDLADAVRGKLSSEQLDEMRTQAQGLCDELGVEMPEEWQDAPPFFESPFDLDKWADAYHADVEFERNTENDQ